MTDKSELATDKEQQDQREFEAELEKAKKLEAMLEHIELLERMTTAEGLNSHYPTMMALINHRNMIRTHVAMFNNIPHLSTFAGYSDRHNLKTKLEADLKKLDAAVNDMLTNLDKTISADNPYRETALKAIYDHTQPGGHPVAGWEIMIEATQSPNFSLTEMWKRLH
ncbi:hypothetical protein KCU99_g3355, partial [Aureobasidium melanogenum]